MASRASHKADAGPSHKPADAGPSTAAYIGGLALVGAAAGYAALALRFRGGISNRGTGSAEMRAAQAFIGAKKDDSATWLIL